MGPALAQLVEHLTVVVSTLQKGRAKYIFIKANVFGYTFFKGIVVIKMSLVRIRQAGKIF